MGKWGEIMRTVVNSGIEVTVYSSLPLGGAENNRMDVLARRTSWFVFSWYDGIHYPHYRISGEIRRENRGEKFSALSS